MFIISDSNTDSDKVSKNEYEKVKYALDMIQVKLKYLYCINIADSLKYDIICVFHKLF